MIRYLRPLADPALIAVIRWQRKKLKRTTGRLRNVQRELRSRDHAARTLEYVLAVREAQLGQMQHKLGARAQINVPAHWTRRCGSPTCTGHPEEKR